LGSKKVDISWKSVKTVASKTCALANWLARESRVLVVYGVEAVCLICLCCTACCSRLANTRLICSKLYQFIFMISLDGTHAQEGKNEERGWKTQEK
jgi:hypothetical protein